MVFSAGRIYTTQQLRDLVPQNYSNVAFSRWIQSLIQSGLLCYDHQNVFIFTTDVSWAFD